MRIMEHSEPHHVGAGEGGKEERKDTLPREANNSSAWILPMLIISLSLTVNTYMLSNVFPYVGVMVAQMLRLPSMNEAGVCRGNSIPHPSHCLGLLGYDVVKVRHWHPFVRRRRSRCVLYHT